MAFDEAVARTGPQGVGGIAGRRREEDVRRDRVHGPRQHVLRGDRRPPHAPGGTEGVRNGAVPASCEGHGFHGEADERDGLRRARGVRFARRTSRHGSPGRWSSRSRSRRSRSRRTRSSVRNAPEEEAVGGGVDPGGGPVARPKDFSDVIRGMLPLPRVHHRPDDVAHHVAKKSRAGHVDG